MDNITKAIIICLIVFYLVSIKMVTSSAKFLRKNGEKFSIMDLEFPPSQKFIQQLITDFAKGVKESVIKNLNDDYIFMIAVYLGIALMCFKARDFTHGNWPIFLTCIGSLQVLPWLFDIYENVQIRKWIDGGEVTNNLGLFKIMVLTKFTIAITGAVLSLGVFLTYGWCT